MGHRTQGYHTRTREHEVTRARGHEDGQEDTRPLILKGLRKVKGVGMSVLDLRVSGGREGGK